MKVICSEQLEWTTRVDHGSFLGRRKELGGDKLGCGLWELPPGKKSFPFHLHHVTEEAMFVVSGSAKVRTPEGLTPISKGDFVSFPAGGPAHQLINDGSEPLIYLAISAGAGADVVEYPDAGKVACSHGKWPNMKRFIFNAKDQADYWAGED